VVAQPATNMQIIEERIMVILDSILSRLPDNPEMIAIEINVYDRELKAFLINQVVQYFDVHNTNVSLDSARFKIFFENFDISVNYLKTKSGMVGLDTDLKRLIKIDVSGYLIDHQTLDVVDAFSFKPTIEDYVSSSDKGFIENSAYAFCSGNIEGSGNWTKYIEPGVVITSVAGVIFLFFSLRF